MAYGPNGTEFPDYSPRSPQPQPESQPPQERRPREASPSYGDPAQQPRSSRRPQAYDPFQTRAHDEAAEQHRQAGDGRGGRSRRGGESAAPSADQNQYGGGWSYDDGYGGGAPRRTGRPGADQYGSDQYGGNRGGVQQGGVQQGSAQQSGARQGDADQTRIDPYAAGRYGAEQGAGRQYSGGDRYAADPYGGDPRRRDGYGADQYGRRDQYGQADPYAADPYAATAVDEHGPRPRAASPTRAALRAGATGLLEEDENGAYRPGTAAGADGGDGDGPDGPNGPGGRSSRRKGKKPVPPHILRRRKMIRRSILGVFVIVVGYVGITIYPYITGPGTDPLNARVAEWGRDHGLGWAVTWLENASYKPPATGGQLNSSQLSQLQGPSAPTPTTKSKAPADLPANITPLASGTIAGEGVWRPVTYNSANVPIVEKAALRPDAQHTSDLAYAVWMNQSALKFGLHPGYQQPGGTWQAPDTITPGARNGLVATWNGGFKIKPDDALGGFYAEGKTAVPLVNGKAAEVFYQDGSIKIGLWGRDETMSANVVGVRENLSLLVDNSQVTVGPGDGSSAQWGYTIKNSYFIARSGVGMTAKGDIVYVSGAQLSVYTLAKLLQAAGCVYAMELDINPDWVSFMYYNGDPANPTPNKLWDFVQPANRYFEPSDRDFVSVYLR
jgi:Phosphodiester glycosidase